MKSNVLFRGFSKKEEAWRFGDLVHGPEDSVSIQYLVGGKPYSEEVYPESVGQCVGRIVDGIKTPVKLFEGDILMHGPSGVKSVVRYDPTENCWMVGNTKETNFDEYTVVDKEFRPPSKKMNHASPVFESRGKRCDGGGWATGFFWQVYEHTYIRKVAYITPTLSEPEKIGEIIFDHPVTPETVGRCSGMQCYSKDGKLSYIFEGDIIEFDPREWGSDRGNKFLVSFDEKNAEWDFGGGSLSDMEWRTIIGNIYDNPELLK